MTCELKRKLLHLELRGVAAQLDELVAMLGSKSPTEMLECIAEIESVDRAQRSLNRRQKRSRIGHFKPLADFDWNWPKQLDRRRVDSAVKLQFLREGANLVIVGAHGLGKTMLLKNIANLAVLDGYSTLFISAARLLADLGSIDSPSLLARRLTFYCSFRLLCIDELGYLSYDDRAADLLFEIVSRRYNNQRSIALSTNLAFKDWPTVFPHATCTVALVDRLTHRVDIIKIEGSSWRRKEAQERYNSR